MSLFTNTYHYRYSKYESLPVAWEDASVQWQAGCEMTEKDKEKEYFKIKPNAYAILCKY